SLLFFGYTKSVCKDTHYFLIFNSFIRTGLFFRQSYAFLRRFYLRFRVRGRSVRSHKGMTGTILFRNPKESRAFAVPPDARAGS
ncbi:hypothetical protein, partial [Rikenella microfusus]|uniref:hypothetical protein n=1 Tax=Rikenella microfusus TaxID=28139 RepID=UPI003AB32A48